LLQSLLAGHAIAETAILGAAIVLIFYAIVGGRTYCAFVCPMNLVTDAARWLAKRANLPKGWQPNRDLRLWILGTVLLAAALTGTLAWEFLNPVSALHRGLIFGMGYAWTLVLAVFLFDLLVSRRGWCGHLCPTGAFYALVGSFGLPRVAVKDRAACDDCMDCFAVCPEPHVITPALRGTSPGDGPIIQSRECTNCGRCIDVCANNVLAFDIRYLRPALFETGIFRSARRK
jgi:ferredoxin-type protein NapH